jgi:tetratricopeptide (TPR) repeat protein
MDTAAKASNDAAPAVLNRVAEPGAPSEPGVLSERRASSEPRASSEARPSSGAASPAPAAGTTEVAAELDLDIPRTRAVDSATEVAVAPSVLRGEIGSPAVPALLLRLFNSQASGELELRSQRTRKVIYLLSGHPIFVQSNLRSETLGELLVRRGGLTEEQHHSVLVYANQNHLKYGEALARTGLLSEREVMQELVNQTRFKIRSCLRWPQGEYMFSEDLGVGSRVPRCTIDPTEAVIGGLAAHQDPQAVLAQLFQEGVIRKIHLDHEAFAPCEQAFRAAFGDRLLRAVQSEPILSALIADDMPHKAALAVDALILCGLATLEQPAEDIGDPLLAPPPIEEAPTEQLERVAGVEVVSLDSLVPPLADEAWATLGPEQRTDELDGAPTPGVRLAGDWAAPQASSAEHDRIALALIESMYLGLHEKNHYDVLGVIPETDENGIEVAYRIKRRQFDLAQFRECDLGEAYGHLEEICIALDEAYSTLGDPVRRAAYDASISTRREPAPSPAMEAEAAFRDGLGQLANGDLREAKASLARAVGLSEEPEYRVQLVYATFLVEQTKHAGQAEQRSSAGVAAMVELQTLMADNPQLTSAHLVSGRVSASLGTYEEALAHWRDALKIDPSCREAFDSLEKQLLEDGELEQLESEYRRLIYRIGTRDREWASSLWKRLVLLYRDELGDRERARKACDAAFRLDPHDSELRNILLQLDSGDATRWPKAVLGYRALLRGNPDDASPLVDLFRLHSSAGRNAAALAAASAARLKGVSDPTITIFLQQQAQKDDEPALTGKWREQAFNDEIWSATRHSGDDPYLSQLFEALDPLINKLHPLTLEDLDLQPASDDSMTSLELRGAVEEVCEIFGLELPEVRVKPELGTDVQGAATTPLVLLVGQSALELSAASLLFRVARALFLLLPGRRVVGWRSSELLRDYLMAVVSLVYPELMGDHLPAARHERVEQIRTQLIVEEQLFASCKEAVAAIHDRGEQLDFGLWQSGILRSAERAALLVCGTCSSPEKR